MDLQNWIDLARSHWQEHLPEMTRRLKQNGTLESSLQEAADETFREVTELEDSGMQPDEAWQTTREKYLLLKPETLAA